MADGYSPVKPPGTSAGSAGGGTSYTPARPPGTSSSPAPSPGPTTGTFSPSGGGFAVVPDSGRKVNLPTYDEWVKQWRRKHPRFIVRKQLSGKKLRVPNTDDPLAGAPPNRTRHEYNAQLRQAARGDYGAPGDLMSLAFQAHDIVSSIPSGVANLAAAAGKEIVSSPVNLVGGIAEGDPERAIGGIPGLGQVYGIGRGFVTGEESGNNPLSSMFGSSFRRTAEDIRHPTHFVQAYNEGHIVGKVLEDVANVSIAAGAFAKGLNVASRGGYLAAETASNTAKAAEAGVTAAEAAAEKAASTAAANHAAAESLRTMAENARFTVGRAQASAAYDKAAALARDSDVAVSQAEEAVTAARAHATEARDLATKRLARAGVGYNAYRTARVASNLAGQGAALPAKPFEYLGKMLSKESKAFLDSSPWLKDQITKFDDKVGLSKVLRDRRMVKYLSTQIRDVEGVRAGEAIKIAKALQRIEKLSGGDDRIYQAALAVDDLGVAIREQVGSLESLRTPEAIDGIKRVLEEVSTGAGYEAGALGLAVDIAMIRDSEQRLAEAVNAGAPEATVAALRQEVATARARVPDQAVVQRVADIQKAWDDSIAPIQERIVTEAEAPGRRRNPNENERKMAGWTSNPAEAGPEGTVGLPPGRVERTVNAGAATTAGLESRLGDLADTLQKRLERAGLENLPADATPAERLKEAARQVAKERATKRVPKALRDVQAAARAEGRLGVSEKAAERIRRLRETIPDTVSDEAVQRLSDAVGTLEEAQARLSRAPKTADPESIRVLVEDVRAARASLTEMAAAERQAMAPLPFDALPYVPGDLSEFHQALQDEIARGFGDIVDDRAIGRALDNQKGRVRNLPDEERFVAAYKTAYNKLPRAVKNALELMSDTEIRYLFRHRNNALYEGTAVSDLPALAMEYANGGGLAEGVTGHEAISAMLADYAHAIHLDALAKQKGGIDPALLNVLEQSSRSDLGQFIRSPETRAAIERAESRVKGKSWTVEDAAREVARVRSEAAIPAGQVPLPDVGRLGDALDNLSVDATQAERLNAVMAAFGDVEGPEATRFFEAFQRAGEPELTDDILIAMSEGEPPPWLAGRRAEAPAPVEGPVPIREQIIRRAAESKFPGTAGAARQLAAEEGIDLGAAAAIPTTRAESVPWRKQIADDAVAFADSLPEEMKVYAGELRKDAAAVRRLTGKAEFDQARFNEFAAKLRDRVEEVRQIAQREGRLPARPPESVLPEGMAQEVLSGEQATAALGGESPEVAAARSEIKSVMATEGGQAIDPRLAREQGLLSATATNAAKTIDKAAGVEGEAIGTIAEPAAREGVKRGKKLAKVEDTIQKMNRVQRQIDAVPARVEAQIEKLYGDVRNAPANYRHSIRMAREFSEALKSWRQEVVDAAEKTSGYVDPAMMAVFDQVLEQGVKDVRDFFFHVAEPGGRIALAEKLPYPRFIPGGRPLERVVPPPTGPEAKPVRARRSPEEVAARGGPRPRTIEEMRLELGSRIRVHTRNDAARLVAHSWGKRADDVLGDVEGLTPDEITAAMAARPERFKAWDQEAFFQSLRSPKGAVVKEAEFGPGFDAAVWAHSQLWIPEAIFDAIKSYYGEAGRFEQLMRQVDKGRNIWRAAVLALRPAWHVNNIVGNAFMAMVGAGMSPAEYTRRIRQANALLKLPEAQLDVALPESVVRTGLFKGSRAKAAANPARLAKLEARIAKIEPETLQALDLGVRQGPGLAPGERIAGADSIPATVSQRGAGAALLPQSAEELLANPGRLKRFVDKSYALNGAVDDMNRLAVFLSSRAKLSEAEVSQFATKYPELASLPRDRLRTEGAVRISLKVAGDFLRMTPLERQVFRRFVPFYGWIRHITQLALRLPVYSPARTVWILHLADMFGEPQGEYGLQNTLPIGFGGGLLQIPALNPFQDVVVMPGSSEPRNPGFRGLVESVGGDVGFNLSPEIKVLAGLAGIDINRADRFSRPPGQPGGYGGPPGAAPVAGSPSELLGLLSSQFPQSRLLRSISDQLRYGTQAMHYPLGQVRRSSVATGRKVVPSGSPLYGPLAQYLGLPFPRKPNVYEKQDLARYGR